jgi:hypothetical protein
LNVREERALIAVRACELATSPGNTAASVVIARTGRTLRVAAAMLVVVETGASPITIPIMGSTTSRGRVTTEAIAEWNSLNAREATFEAAHAWSCNIAET